VLRAVRLPLTLPGVPHEELATIRAQDFWMDHRLGQRNGSGRWLVAREHREIPYLSAYPALIAVADVVPAKRYQLWVSVLEAGGIIATHADSARAGAVRVHVPLVGEGTFEVEEQAYRMAVGEYWAVDTVGRAHGARNDGTVDRIHLLVDVLPNPWLREHVPWL
jgi:quercetin dioxygenase-like cupin family protein